MLLRASAYPVARLSPQHIQGNLLVWKYQAPTSWDPEFGYPYAM